jgi:TM2 domain-containing membrane protein YozV
LTQENVNLMIIKLQEKLPSSKLFILKQKLEVSSDDKIHNLQSLPLKSPIIILVFSIFLGQLGVDRFMAGDIGLGVLKLLTCGGAGIWWFIDIFLIMGKVKEDNLNKVLLIL